MLKILHAAEDPTPGQTYAHACWRANPRIAASWWRESQGHTVGKIGLDWRSAVTNPQLLTQGANLVLATPATLAATQAALAQTNVAEAACLWLETANPATSLNQTLPPQTILIWKVPADTPQPTRHSTLVALEEASRQGQIAGYGLNDPDLATPHTPLPLHIWLEEAAQAAEQAHGRKKRPALRSLLAGLDLLDFNWLTIANTQHHGQPVSPLELAARLGLMVVATPGAWPQEENTAPPAEALQALTRAAQAEAELAQTLGGWPQREGRPLFSLLGALGQGQAPWPNPAEWVRWQRHQLPFLAGFWQAPATANPALCGPVGAYLQALAGLEPHGAALANHAAQTHLMQVFSHISSQLPAPYRRESLSTQAASLLGSTPGLTVLALPQPGNLQAVQVLEDFPDLAFLFTKSPKPT